MTMNFWKPLAIVSSCSLAAIGAYAFVPSAHAGPQPNMEAAAANLRQARTFLKNAAHDKGGHRVKAIDLTDQAIAEVEQGIIAGDK
jgi:hypothetical protein